MTVGAGRGFFEPSGYSGSVDTARIGLRNVFMTLAAGLRNVLPKKLGFPLGLMQQVVRAVAVGTDRGVFIFRARHAMHAMLIAFNRRELVQIKLLHLFRIAMAAGAGGRNIISVDFRLFTGRRNDVMGVTVAILAGGGQFDQP